MMGEMAGKKKNERVKEPESKSDPTGGELDPKEERVLDWILNGIIVFVLSWLGLGVLLSVRGLACSSWNMPGVLCMGIERAK